MRVCARCVTLPLCVRVRWACARVRRVWGVCEACVCEARARRLAEETGDLLAQAQALESLARCVAGAASAVPSGCCKGSP
jgi:hypothetical protein